MNKVFQLNLIFVSFIYYLQSVYCWMSKRTHNGLTVGETKCCYNKTVLNQCRETKPLETKMTFIAIFLTVI